MSDITSFRDLVAWQKSMNLADLIYTITEPFPKREWFGLAHQSGKPRYPFRRISLKAVVTRSLRTYIM
jgi:23S rRNA-intervening sequence protein